MNKPKLVFMTGAGVSRESGIHTFRDSKDGLWNNYKIEEVSSIEGWNKDPALVLEFYNARRREMVAAQPNEAHKLIAALEEFYDVTVITQNIDDLHERAGSTNVIHLHGEINRVREDMAEGWDFDRLPRIYTWEGDMTLEDRSPNGYALRPDVVWFGEGVKRITEAFQAVSNANGYIVVGTSLLVSPANTLHTNLRADAIRAQIDPEMLLSIDGFHQIQEVATVGMKQIYDVLVSENLRKTLEPFINPFTGQIMDVRTND